MFMNFNDIKIKNSSKFIDTDQLIECLKLLNKKHLLLKIEMVIFGSRWQFLAHWLPRFLVRKTDITLMEFKEIFSEIKEDDVGATKGYHCDGKEHRIYIFEFQCLKETNDSIEDMNHKIETAKLDAILGMYHELHHEYQSVNHPILYEKSLSEYEDKDWFDIWVEKDAVEFTKYMVRTNKEKINAILQLKGFDWEFDGFNLQVKFQENNKNTLN